MLSSRAVDAVQDPGESTVGYMREQAEIKGYMRRIIVCMTNHGCREEMPSTQKGSHTDCSGNLFNRSTGAKPVVS